MGALALLSRSVFANMGPATESQSVPTAVRCLELPTVEAAFRSEVLPCDGNLFALPSVLAQTCLPTITAPPPR